MRIFTRALTLYVHVGMVWLWGRGAEGQLGNSSRDNKYSPVPPSAHMVEGTPVGLYGKNITHVTIGDWHTGK